MISTYTKRLTVVNDRFENKLAYKASSLSLYISSFYSRTKEMIWERKEQALQRNLKSKICLEKLVYL